MNNGCFGIHRDMIYLYLCYSCLVGKDKSRMVSDQYCLNCYSYLTNERPESPITKSARHNPSPKKKTIPTHI
jgi:hypothetical protein